MPRRFNQYVRGLLSLLDAKVEGRGPSDFNEILQLTLDCGLLTNYAKAEQAFNTGTLVSGSGGFFSASLAGPAQDEIFVVLDFGAVGSAALITAGDSAALAPAIERRPGTGDTRQPIGPVERFTQNETVSCWATGGPWVLFPNEQLGLHNIRCVVGGAPVAMQYTAKWVRLKV